MRSPAVWLSACSCALVLAGCGGEEPRREPAPTLPAPLAERLAGGADAVAERLEAGDPCGAAVAAQTLNAEAVTAVNTPAVPADLKEPLLASVQELSDRAATECAAIQPPPAPPPTTVEEEDEDEDEDDEGRGRGKGKGKGKGRGRGNKHDDEDDD